jgi:hypothetical protein
MATNQQSECAQARARARAGWRLGILGLWKLVESRALIVVVHKRLLDAPRASILIQKMKHFESWAPGASLSLDRGHYSTHTRVSFPSPLLEFLGEKESPNTPSFLLNMSAPKKKARREPSGFGQQTQTPNGGRIREGFRGEGDSKRNVVKRLVPTSCLAMTNR